MVLYNFIRIVRITNSVLFVLSLFGFLAIRFSRYYPKMDIYLKIGCKCYHLVLYYIFGANSQSVKIHSTALININYNLVSFYHKFLWLSREIKKYLVKSEINIGNTSNTMFLPTLPHYKI